MVLQKAVPFLFFWSPRPSYKASAGALPSWVVYIHRHTQRCSTTLSTFSSQNLTDSSRILCFPLFSVCPVRAEVRAALLQTFPAEQAEFRSMYGQLKIGWEVPMSTVGTINVTLGSGRAFTADCYVLEEHSASWAGRTSIYFLPCGEIGYSLSLWTTQIKKNINKNKKRWENLTGRGGLKHQHLGDSHGNRLE